MKFIIEQIAIAPPIRYEAINLFKELGIDPKSWVLDNVIAEGSVFGVEGQTNQANLSFNYEMLKGAKEFEILDYVDGENWIDHYQPSVSHFGMHCSEEELLQWKEKFKGLGIQIAQEVNTLSHSNPVIAGKRSYHYTIFNTRAILGVDLKFICRVNLADEKIFGMV